MKAKLHKMMSGYILSLNGDIDDPYAIVNKELAEDYGWYKLSLKNCQAIENGYDLDELAEEEAKKRHDWNKHRDTDIYNELVREDAELIKIGLQKALEIFGDKKFSEDDMERAFEIGEDFGSLPFSSYTTSKRLNKKEFIQSLQKTEWDVEIEMEFAEEEQTGTHLVWGRTTPKLDSDGCLILKLKSE